MGANLIVQPCFAVEVQELARPTLGKRGNLRKEEYC